MPVIRRLPPEVVNRIAAGEVVQRPSAALKELLENALDAGSSAITVTAVEGGLELLQVSDDGCGVAYDDLPLLCARYATSKLRRFDDLQHIRSFGFRGEALASISYVARVTVITRQRRRCTDSDRNNNNNNDDDASETAASSRRLSDEVAWLCRYRDGALVQTPEACARSVGTTIRAEKMFHLTAGAAMRRAALRPAEEWSRIVDVVTRYAFAFPHVSFTCTRATTHGGGGGGGGGSDVYFPRHSTTLDNICLAHGRGIASHLHLIHHIDDTTTTSTTLAASDDNSNDNNDTIDNDKNDATTTTTTTARPQHGGRGGDAEVWRRYAAAAAHVETLCGDDAGAGRFALAGYASDSGLQSSSSLHGKTYVCLFVNRRLVDSAAVRRAIDAAYSGAALPAARRPFVVLFLSVPADRVDVNVHPSKKEVSVLDEDVVLSRLTTLLQNMLLATAASRQLAVVPPSMCSSNNSGSELYGAPSRRRYAGDRADTPASAMSLHATTAATSAAAATAAAATGALPPSCVVRVEPQKGALDRFVRARTDVVAIDDDDADVRVAATVTAPPTKTSQAVHGNDEAATSAATAAAVVRVPQSISSASLMTDDDDDDKAAADLMLEFTRHRREVYATASSDTARATSAAATTTTTTATTTATTADDDKMAALLHYCTRSDAARQRQHDHDDNNDNDDHGDTSTHTTSSVLAQQSSSSSPATTAAAQSPSHAQATSLVPVVEVYDRVLSSVQRIVRRLVDEANSDAARRLIDGLVFVGVADALHFFAQSGTVLYLFDTLRIVRMVVYARIFLRWAQPALPRPARFVFRAPVPLRALLCFALRHDVAHMTPAAAALPAVVRAQLRARRRRHCQDASPSPPSADDVTCGDAEVAAYVRRLLQRLASWRDMLADYFDIHISADDCLTALPCGLNVHWPPLLRAVPLFVWQLAATVPYPDDDNDNNNNNNNVEDNEDDEEEAAVAVEQRCFEHIAHCIADTLYGLAPHRAWCTHDDNTNDNDDDDDDKGDKTSAAAATMLSSDDVLADDDDDDATTTTTVPSLETAIQHGLLPCLKNTQLCVVPASLLTDGSVRAVVSVEALYKVFERC